MYDTPIIDGLLKYVSEKNISFHMPGHKNNRRHFEKLETIKNNLYEMDNTEVPGLDNLHLPREMILGSEKLAAKAYGAGRTYFLVNGSTSGIYAMILGVTRPGDKIIVERNCHRSVYTACILGGLETVYVKPYVLPEFDIPVSLDVRDVICTMDENPDAKAIVITYPTYYGTCCDLKTIADEAHKRNMYVLVDEAHGAHLPFNKRLPKNAMELCADISVDSVHKTLPAMTQTAILNVRDGLDIDGIRFMTSAFQSTSPSYILMASIEAAIDAMAEDGDKLLDELICDIEKFKYKAKDVGGIKFLEKDSNSFICDYDVTRIVINTEFGGRTAERELRRKYNIQVEMSDSKNIVLICTVGNMEHDFEKLYYALQNMSRDCQKKSFEHSMDYPYCRKVLNLKEAYYSQKESMELEKSSGMIAGEMVVPYPPGIPLILPGEVITNDVINYIKEMKCLGIDLNGMKDSTAEFIQVIRR